MRGTIVRATARALLVASLPIAGCGREPKPPAPGAVAADSTRALRQRLVALEAARSFGGDALPRALRHPDARVRRAAAMALGRIQDPAATLPLVAALEDPDTTVTEQAAWALGQLKGQSPEQRHALQAALVPRVEAKPKAWLFPYVEALGKQGGAEIVPILEADLATGLLAGMGSEARPPALEGIAVWSLARLKTESARGLIALLEDLRNRAPEAAWRIAAAMAADPDSLNRYRASLLSLLDHTDALSRAAGARAIGKSKDRTCMPALVQHLSDSDWRVRASLLLAMADLAKTSGPDREAQEFASALLSDRHPLVREAAAIALDSLEVGTQGELLHAAFGDSVAAVRLAALRCAAHWEHGAARTAWDAARADRVEWVRTGALHAAHFVLGAPGAVDVLVPLLRSGSVRERLESAEALGEFTAPSAARAKVQAALEAALADPDFAVAATAAGALGAGEYVTCIPALAAAYDTRRATHNDGDVRLAAVEAARDLAGLKTRLGTPAWTALFERAGGDGDLRVANAARAGAAKLSGKTAPAPLGPQARVGVRADSLPPIDLGRVRVRLVTARGTAILELDGDNYPRTVGSFLRLVDSGFYQHAVFHRVVPAFVVQGGCPRGDGWGDAGYNLPCEYGDLHYDAPGVVGMAHAGKDTGGSQFFITHVPVPRLDGNYTAFGRVVEGMGVIDQIIRGDAFHLERIAAAATPASH